MVASPNVDCFLRLVQLKSLEGPLTRQAGRRIFRHLLQGIAVDLSIAEKAINQ